MTVKEALMKSYPWQLPFNGYFRGAMYMHVRHLHCLGHRILYSVGCADNVLPHCQYAALSAPLHQRLDFKQICWDV